MKTAIVTGASGGIGSAISKILSRNGYNVLINYNNSEEKAKSLMKEIIDEGGSCDIFKADVSDETQVSSMIDYTLDIFGDIDLLVNNAGIDEIKLFSDFSLTQWQKIIDVNLTGTFLTSKKVAPIFIHKKSGKIINITSMWGQVGASCEVPYSSAKAGIIGFTKSLAKELAPSNITVNGVAPGVIDTNMMAGFSADELEDIISEIPLGRMGTPDDVAKSVLFLAEDGDYITGQIIAVNGGYVI
jgi:3-oxoacyl-[acyl-carrier protein] reductase